MTQYGYVHSQLRAEHDGVVGGQLAESDLESCAK